VNRQDGQNLADQIADDCLMTRWRAMNRVLTAIYDEELRRFHLKSSQLSRLVALTKAGPVRRLALGRYLSLDPSTLTRNLQVMLKNGWIKEVPDGGDRRGAPLEVTSKGRKLLESVGPAWQAAQTRAKKMLGGEATELVMSMGRNPRITAGG